MGCGSDSATQTMRERIERRKKNMTTAKDEFTGRLKNISIAQHGFKLAGGPTIRFIGGGTAVLSESPMWHVEK